MVLIGVVFIWIVTVVIGRSLVHAVLTFLPPNVGRLVLVSLLRAVFYAPAAPFGILMVPTVVYIILVAAQFPENIPANPTLFLFSVLVFVGSVGLGVANGKHKPASTAEKV